MQLMTPAIKSSWGPFPAEYEEKTCNGYFGGVSLFVWKDLELRGINVPKKLHWKYFRWVVSFPAIVSLWHCWGGSLVFLPCPSPPLVVLPCPAGAQQDLALGVFRSYWRCERSPVSAIWAWPALLTSQDFLTKTQTHPGIVKGCPLPFNKAMC